MSTVCNNQPSAPVLGPQPEPAAPEKSTYGQILKSSTLVGGSQLLNIAIGIVRTKVMAVLLGPAGTGLFGLYNSIADLAQSIAGMGVNGSGVRQIAEAAGCDNVYRIGRTAAVLRRMSIVLGLLGTVLLVAVSGPVSIATFGNNQHTAAVSLLSIAVFFRVVSAGQGALIQGMRRISDLAKMGVLGALAGTLISIPMVYVLREKGIVPSLIAVAATTIATSWWYSRKIDVPATSMTASQVRQEATSLLKLGFAFMASGLMTMGAAYVVRTTVLHRVGVEATGLYQSAWTLGGLYVGFILQAMGADFYPRLTARANDNPACNRMVNEQARVGLLLAGPGVIATLTFAPLVIALFYTTKFAGAVEVLRWICLGVTLRVITWPIGFIILAKGNQPLFFWSELAWTVVNVTLTWICVGYFGLVGAGIAFFGSYVFHGILIYTIVSRLSDFRWSSENRKTGSLFFASIAFVFCGLSLLPFPLAAGLGVLAAVLSGVYSIRVFLTMFSLDQIPRPVSQLLARFGFEPPMADRLP
jgi:enterobacterial common antigen flippase